MFFWVKKKVLTAKKGSLNGIILMSYIYGIPNYLQLEFQNLNETRDLMRKSLKRLTETLQKELPTLFFLSTFFPKV